MLDVQDGEVSASVEHHRAQVGTAVIAGDEIRGFRPKPKSRNSFLV